ncbi:hypothetical protein NIES3585_43580 [Nodularia sp. NIES-3585]|nr:hypothetical protein NIES3585_43580 [Nodularia sp. NIES-3585]
MSSKTAPTSDFSQHKFDYAPSTELNVGLSYLLTQRFSLAKTGDN